MLRNTLILASLLTALVVAGPAAAQEWKFDKDHTYVFFEVKHVFATARGEFMEHEGTLDFDPENPEAASIRIVVNAASLDTGITKRDNHLRSEDFFEVNRYPELKFESVAVRPEGKGKFMVEGDLTIKDVTKRITVPMIYYGIVDSPLEKGKEVAGFDFSFTIDRLEYNVGTGKFWELGALDRDVDILVTLEMLRDK